VLRLRSKIALAVTAMMDVALNYPHGPVPLSKICGRRKISMTYLEEIFSRLMAHRLVESTRGPGGGYSLSKGPEEINLADIALAVDESMGSNLSMISDTMKSDLWADFNRQIVQHLRSINLQQLVHEQQYRQKSEMAKPMFTSGASACQND
jgi:Rrf2 family transcriptional regulator, iron-sulfur cluster assembly transcription factor